MHCSTVESICVVEVPGIQASCYGWYQGANGYWDYGEDPTCISTRDSKCAEKQGTMVYSDWYWV